MVLYHNVLSSYSIKMLIHLIFFILILLFNYLIIFIYFVILYEYIILNSFMLFTLINIHIFYLNMFLIFVLLFLSQNILHILLCYHYFMIISLTLIFIVKNFDINNRFLFMFVSLLFFVYRFWLKIHPSFHDLFNYQFIDFIASYHLLKIFALQKIL